MCQEAALGPVRELDVDVLMNLPEDSISPVGLSDFTIAFDHVKPSVSQKDLAALQEWNEQYGSFKSKQLEEV